MKKDSSPNGTNVVREDLKNTPADLRKDYLWNTIGTSANSFISLLLLIVVTRVNGIGDSGLFSFAFSYTIVFFTIGLYGGRIYQVSDIQNEFENRAYIFLKLLTSIFMFAAAVVFILANGYGPDRAALLLSLTVYKILDAIADPLYGVLQRRSSLWLAGVSMTLKAVSGFAAFTAVLLWTHDMLLASLCLIGANLLFILCWDIPKMRAREAVGNVLRGNFAHGLLLLRRSTWIFAFALLTTLLVNIPRYFVDIEHPKELGAFGIIIMPATLLNLFVTFLIFPKLVGLSETFATGGYASFSRSVSKLLIVSLAFGILATLVVWLIGAPVLSFIYNVDLYPYRAAMTLVVAGGTLNTITMICSNVLSVMRRFPPQLFCYLAAVIVAFATSIPLVAAQAVSGGVLSFVIANAVQAAAFFIVYRTVLRRLFE